MNTPNAHLSWDKGHWTESAQQRRDHHKKIGGPQELPRIWGNPPGSEELVSATVCISSHPSWGQLQWEQEGAVAGAHS